MISMRVGTHRFQLRAAVVLVRDAAVLLHRAEGDDFWTLPGGRVEPGEAAENTVVREMREELDAEVRPTRLVWLAETFFDYDEEAYHEVGLYFMADVAGSGPLTCGSRLLEGKEGDRKLEFVWFAVAELAGLDIQPSFLRKLLVAQDFSFRHVVHRDEKNLTP